MGTSIPSGFPFLAGCSAASREKVARLPIRQVDARTPVLRRGDMVSGVYLVTQGSLRVYYLTEEGREATLYEVTPGETCILALTSAFRREPYPAWVETGDATLHYALVPGPLFRELYDQEPSFREFLFEVLSTRVFELMSTLEQVGSRTVEQRIAAFLLHRCDERGTVVMSQARIAAHTGTAREVVSRTLRGLSERGVVRTARNRVVVLERDVLLELQRSG